MLAKEELEKIDKELKQAAKEARDHEKLFWSNEYPLKTQNEKVKFWAGNLFRSMRSQEECGQKPLSIYKEVWLKEVLKVEPEFMQLLPEIYRVWGGMFDRNKVDSKIKKLFSTLNK